MTGGVLGNDIGAIMGSLAESLGIGENNRTMDVFRLMKLLDGSTLQAETKRGDAWIMSDGKADQFYGSFVVILILPKLADSRTQHSDQAENGPGVCCRWDAAVPEFE